MKKNIEDYINKGDYAVLCSSIEEWNAIVDLINKNHVSTTTQPYSETKSNVLNLQNLGVTIGTGTLKSFPSYIIYSASDFLEKEFTFEKEKSLVKQVQEGLKLKGRWLKCIKQCDWNTINVGEYIQILENNSLVPYVEWKDNEEGHCIDLGRIDKKEFELMPEEFSLNEKTEYKVGDWVFGKSLGTSNYNKCKHPVKIIEIKEDRFKYDLLSNPKTDYPRNKSCFYYLSTIVRKATEQDIAMHLGSIIHNQYPLTPIESFQLSIYDLKDIYIAPIIKKETKIQTITIESTTDLNLNLKTIKSKQIQTIKI